jgi:hypothetical protein
MVCRWSAVAQPQFSTVPGQLLRNCSLPGAFETATAYPGRRLHRSVAVTWQGPGLKAHGTMSGIVVAGAPTVVWWVLSLHWRLS